MHENDVKNFSFRKGYHRDMVNLELKVLYGVPPPPSSFPRLGALARQLGPESLSVLVDHPDTVDHLIRVRHAVWPRPMHLFIKVDTGYHRAGAAPESTRMKAIIDMVDANCDQLLLQGFYSHMGHSYGFSSPEEALEGLAAEIQGAGKAAALATKKEFAKKLTITVGATPTATGAQSILSGNTSSEAQKVQKVLKQTKENFEVELHAGVYPVLDLQQLATRARPSPQVGPTSTHPSMANLGLRVLVEVTSVYEDRGKPQALVAAGTLALGREPCKSYPGWGIVTPWQSEDSEPAPDPVYSEDDRRGWIVGKISQEHGILEWEGPEQEMRPLVIGDKLMLWPNHACVAGSGFGWYLVVDTEKERADPDVIQDVWVRGRGW